MKKSVLVSPSGKRPWLTFWTWGPKATVEMGVTPSTANKPRASPLLDREKVRAAIAATDLTTVEGPVKFRADGTGVLQSVLVQWINGKQELIWPKESATMPVVYPAPPFAKR